jgi:hypothetical protein
MKTQHTRIPLGRSISLLFAAAAIMAIGAEGFLAAPAAHAESCTVNGSQLQLRVHPDFTYTVTVGANGSTLAGEVFSTVAGQDGVSGNATGSIAGNAVDFIVTWNPADGGGTTHFRGTVGADGVATGTATGASAQDLNKHLEFAPGPWESVAPLTCPAAGAPAAQAPAAQPKQGPSPPNPDLRVSPSTSQTAVEPRHSARTPPKGSRAALACPPTAPSTSTFLLSGYSRTGPAR